MDPAHLQLTSRQHYWISEKTALPGAIRDCAPDRWGQQLIRRAFQKSKTNQALTELDYLLALNDFSRVGDLRFKRKGDTDFHHSIGHRTAPSLISLPELLNATIALQSYTEPAEDLRLLLHEGSPLGGARPKSAIINSDGSLAIAKFPAPNDEYSIPHGEILALMLGERAGINVAKGSFHSVGKRSVAIIQRFDRIDLDRIAFLSAMSLLGLQDGDTSTYTDIAECIRMYSISPIQDLHELWRRVVFNVMISNLDDHLCNHGFLYASNNQWALSPAYDLNPIPIYKKERHLSTWISDEGSDAHLELALGASAYFALKLKDAKKILHEVATAVNQWRELAQQLGMSKADIEVYETAISVTE